MTRITKILSIATLTLTVSSISAFAQTAYKTPAETLSGLTNQTVEAVTSERTTTNKTYGTLAKEKDVLESFKNERLENKKALINEKVQLGTLTQEEADALIAQIEERMSNCDGTGAGRMDPSLRLGQGRNGGQGKGMGMGKGMGLGNRTGANCQ